MKKNISTNDHFTMEDNNIFSMQKGPGIAPRLFFMIFALLSLMVISSLVSYRGNTKVHDAFEKILDEIPHERDINEVQISITDFIMPANDYLITKDPLEKKHSEFLKKYALLALKKCYQNARDDEKPLVVRVEEDFKNIITLSDKIFSLDPHISKELELAVETMEKMDKLAVDTRQHIQELLNMHDNHMKDAKIRAENTWKNAHRWMTAIFILAVVLGLALASYMTYSILRPLNILDTSAIKISGGDLRELIKIERQGELTSLAESFNKMIVSLRHMIETSKTILYAIADPVFTVDTNMTITYFSKACERLTGYTSDEAIGRKCQEIFKSNICESLCAIKRSARQDKPVLNVEIEIKNKNNEPIPIMASASCLKDWKGNLMGGCEVFRDISDWKKMTKELKEAEQQIILSERMAVLGRLASSVGHELRNPLAVIQNSSYFIKSKITQDQPKLLRHIQIIENEIDSANKIIGDLLGFSRTRKIELSPIDLNATIESSLMRIRIRENIKIVKTLDPNLPLIMGDKDQLHQVIVNLLSNADHAIGKTNGMITIITQRRSNKVELNIQDTGCGIAKEDLDKLFDPFFTTKTKGIGLGMAITKSIIKSHKGTINVNSAKGQGTSFTITLLSSFENEGMI